MASMPSRPALTRVSAPIVYVREKPSSLLTVSESFETAVTCPAWVAMVWNPPSPFGATNSPWMPPPNMPPKPRIPNRPGPKGLPGASEGGTADPVSERTGEALSVGLSDGLLDGLVDGEAAAAATPTPVATAAAVAIPRINWRDI